MYNLYIIKNINGDNIAAIETNADTDVVSQQWSIVWKERIVPDVADTLVTRLIVALFREGYEARWRNSEDITP